MELKFTRKTVLQELIKYGETGNDSCLHSIIARTAAKATFGRVSNILATKVLARFMDVFKAPSLVEKRKPMWLVLSALCDGRLNLSATHFKDKLHGTLIVKYVTEACEHYPASNSQCSVSLDFLHQYIMKDEGKQTLILSDIKILRVLLTVLVSSVAAADYVTLRAIAKALKHVLYSGGPVEQFLYLGGFGKLNNALDTVVSRAVNEYIEAGRVGDELLQSLGQVLQALSQSQKAVRKQIHQSIHDPPVNPSLYCYTLDNAKHHSQLLANAADLLPDDLLRSALFADFYSTFLYVAEFTTPNNDCPERDRPETRERCAKEAMECHLTCTDALETFSVPTRIVYYCRRAEDEFSDVDFVELLLKPLDNLSVQFPALRAALEYEIKEKLVYCSLPGCNVCNLKRGRLKKCVRCMNIWYCGREHQVEHWPAHKQECKRIVAEVAAAEEHTF